MAIASCMRWRRAGPCTGPVATGGKGIRSRVQASLVRAPCAVAPGAVARIAPSKLASLRALARPPRMPAASLRLSLSKPRHLARGVQQVAEPQRGRV